MSIIYSYPESQPTLQDLLIGTDVADENATKSFSVQSLVSLINASQGNGIVTDVTISTSDVFLTAIKTSGIGDPAITYNVGLTSLPTAGLENTQFLRGDNAWVTPTVSAGISVFGNASSPSVTDDVTSFAFVGGSVSTTAGANGSVTVEILEQSSDVSSVTGITGISVNPADGQGNVVVTNTGVTQITTGTGLTATRGGTAVTTGNILLSLDGNAVGAGTVTSVSAGPGLRISGTSTVSPTLSVQYTGAQNVIAQGVIDGDGVSTAEVITQSDQILFNQVSTTPVNVKSTTLGTIPMDSLPLVKQYVDSAERGFVSNLTDDFATAVAKNIITLEQSQYDAIPVVDRNANTLYFTTNVVVVPTESRLIIDTATNITNPLGITITFTGDQTYSGTGSVKTGQPESSFSYSSVLSNATGFSSGLPTGYEWLGGSVPEVINATGTFPATGFVEESTTLSPGTIIATVVTPSTSRLNTTFAKIFTLDGAEWGSAPANLVDVSYIQEPTVNPVISGTPGGTYDNVQKWGVDFTNNQAALYTMSNKLVTYSAEPGTFNNGNVTVDLTANFVTATASGTPSIVIQDLINSDSGAQRNTAYEIRIYPNPVDGSSLYTVPATTTGETVTIEIGYAPFLEVGNVQQFTINATTAWIGPGRNEYNYQFVGPPVSSLSQVAAGPGNTAAFNTQTLTNTLTTSGTTSNTVAWTISGTTQIKTGSSSLTSVGFKSPYSWDVMTPGSGFTTPWTGSWKARAQYRTRPEGSDYPITWTNTAFSTGGTPGAGGNPVFPGASVTVDVLTYVQWRYEIVFSSELTTQTPFVMSATVNPEYPYNPAPPASVTALLGGNGSSTGANNTGAPVSYITPVIVEHYVHLSDRGNSSMPESQIEFVSGKFIENLTYVQNGRSVRQLTAINACCDVEKNVPLYHNGGNASTLDGATVYNDALGLSPTPAGFYQVGQSPVSSINIGSNGVVASPGMVTCAACITTYSVTINPTLTDNITAVSQSPSSTHTVQLSYSLGENAYIDTTPGAVITGVPQGSVFNLKISVSPDINTSIFSTPPYGTYGFNPINGGSYSGVNYVIGGNVISANFTTSAITLEGETSNIRSAFQRGSQGGGSVAVCGDTKDFTSYLQKANGNTSQYPEQTNGGDTVFMSQFNASFLSNGWYSSTVNSGTTQASIQVVDGIVTVASECEL